MPSPPILFTPGVVWAHRDAGERDLSNLEQSASGGRGPPTAGRVRGCSLCADTGIEDLWGWGVSVEGGLETVLVCMDLLSA